MDEYRKGDPVEVLRGNGTWQAGVVVSSTPNEVLVQWGRWKKKIPTPSRFIRKGTTPVPSTVGDYEEYEPNSPPVQEGSCGYCGAGNGLLYPCTGCHSVAYCNETCQNNAWPTHRFDCPQRQGESPRYSAMETTELGYGWNGNAITDLYPHLEIGVAVEACGYTGERSEFNGLAGVVVGYQEQKALIQFHLRNGVVLAITPHHLRPSHPPSPSFPLGIPIAVGSVTGAVGYVVGYRGALILVEFDGKRKGVFPIRTEDAFFVTRVR
eukprot:TRINITY_DN2760_c0_g2_i1.p1 TRINITY_DN2760_c0_g2~~TRINITY_DN2760_c0_g2_i1.p1  ORF type:complete len:279 (+),score=15.85 TRINITY_DN2760_c0_g2_i1:41-838(+)